jgi:hypothetical protein
MKKMRVINRLYKVSLYYESHSDFKFAKRQNGPLNLQSGYFFPIVAPFIAKTEHECKKTCMDFDILCLGLFWVYFVFGFLAIADDIRGSIFRPMEIGWNISAFLA